MARRFAMEGGLAQVPVVRTSRGCNARRKDRRDSTNRPRPLRVEALEGRTLLSLSTGVDFADVFPTQTGTAAQLVEQTLRSESVAASTAAAGSVSSVGQESLVLSAIGSPASAEAAVSAILLGFHETGAGAAVSGAAARPNLTPFKPSGWSDKIVVSSATGTNSGGPLAPDDTLYVDWAGINNGRAAISTSFYVRLYVDGALRNTWYVEPPLDPNAYTYVEDYSIGQLGVGQHKIQIRLDATNAIAESNESDNAYTKTITVSRPNLTPYAPKGWEDKIVVSSVPGTRTANKLYSNNTLYVDWAAINNGAPPVKEPFYTQLFVDGELRNTWLWDPPLNSKQYAQVEDYAIGALSPGKHQIQIRVDTTNAVSEGSEKDNVFTKTITVHPPILKPNLTPYQPDGWSDRIVISTVTGSNIDAENFRTTDTLYVDWAGINNGNAATAKPFTSQLFVDGKLARTFTTPAPLNPDRYASAEDVAIGPLSAGRHTIQIRLDTGNAIGELNEKDNTFSRTITVTSDPSIRFVAHYTDSPGEGFYDPQRGPARRAAFEYALAIWSSALAKAYEGETITVSASMDPMGGSENHAVLGSAGPKLFRWNFGGGAMANTVYGDPLANHLAGRDLSPGSPEIVAQFNSDLDNPTVLGSTDWYYGLDGNANDDIDFVSVVLHEVGHGLNFIDTVNSGTGGWSIAGYPGIYDRFLENGGGTRLTAMDNAGRKAAIVSNNLFWGGSQGRAGNGGTRPKMYAPNPYEPGSSVAHTDETVHGNDLMSPTYSGPVHTPGPIDLGILADMGWNLRAGGASTLVLGAAMSPIGPEGWAPFGPLVPHHYERTPPPARDAERSGMTDGALLAAVDWTVSDLAVRGTSLVFDARSTGFLFDSYRAGLWYERHPAGPPPRWDQPPEGPRDSSFPCRIAPQTSDDLFVDQATTADSGPDHSWGYRGLNDLDKARWRLPNELALATFDGLLNFNSRELSPVAAVRERAAAFAAFDLALAAVFA